MNPPAGTLSDDELVEVFLTPVRLSADYRPAFGQGAGSQGLDYEGFSALYGTDPLYAWLGLDDPAMYAAHKAAGGITSVYRQIGIGSERLLRAILGGVLGLSKEQLDWSYSYLKDDGKEAVHYLDARVQVDHLDGEGRERVKRWLADTVRSIPTPSSGAASPVGVVMEIRQGYKSADSKRQNADLRYGMRAYQADLLPAVVVMSSQVSEPVIRRYRADGILVLTGRLDGSPAESTFAFFREVVGYDLAGFMERNTDKLKSEITAVVRALLSA